MQNDIFTEYADNMDALDFASDAEINQFIAEAYASVGGGHVFA